MDAATQTVDTEQPERVGMYLRPETRDRLNMYKARRRMETGRFYSQTDAIEELLDIADSQRQAAV